jgi:demethylmenaquinone methyltransferase / 2-methoxy-6-polyprenyl-1,4-benzoquinol methylase
MVAPVNPEIAGQGFVRRLFAPLAPRYDLLVEVLSMGQNRRWRRTMVDRLVSASDRERGAGIVADVACGTAGVSLQLAERLAGPVLGIDLSREMLERGRENVAHANREGHVQLIVGDAQRLPFGDASFKALSFTYLLRYVDDPQATLTELARVLEPGGAMASLEFFVPPDRFWRSWWWLYTRLLLPVAGWMSGGRQWWDVGRFLGPSISRHYAHYPLDWTVMAWRRAGLDDVGVRIMSLGGGLVMWGRRNAAR